MAFSTNLVPRFLLVNDFLPFEDRISKCRHVHRSFKRGEPIWKLGEYIDSVFYIESGVAQTHVVHEMGYEKLVWFIGRGSVYPGCHESQFKIEKSMETIAFTDIEAMQFSRDSFHEMVVNDPELASAEIEFFAKMINIGLYQSAHQEYNDSFMRLCNLIHLLSLGDLAVPGHIMQSQKGFAEMLGMERANVARHLSRLAREGIIVTHRGWIELVDSDALLGYCSYETLES